MRRSIFLAGAVLLASACADYKTGPLGRPELSIFPDTATLRVDDDSQFIAVVGGDFGGTPTVSWRSSPTTIASVSSNGLVMAHAPGSALIIVRAKGSTMLEDTAMVTVQ